MATSTIRRITGYELACALPRPQGKTTGFFSERTALVVAVEAADGTVGWGETWQLPAAAAAMIRAEFGAVLLGRRAGDVRPLWHEMTARIAYDRRGASMMAVGALDLALWDLAARLEGKPLGAFLGGALRDRLPVYGSGPFFVTGPDPYASFARDVEGYLDAGFRAIKPRIGTRAPIDRKIAAALRAQVGDDVGLMADLACGFTAAAAIEIAHGLAEAGFWFMEEPLLPDNNAGYRRLSDAAILPIAGGESLIGLTAFRDFVVEGRPDVLQPDLSTCGGLSEGLRIAALADAWDIPVIPHVWGTAIHFHAALHFAAILPAKRGAGLGYPIFEYDFSPNPLIDMGGRPALDADGCLAVPDGPGIGIDPTPEMLAPFVVERWVLEA